MDDLDEFFKNRDDRLAREKAEAERQQKDLGEKRQRLNEEAKLLHAKGLEEYGALKQEVRSLAEKYSPQGFIIEGERVRLNGAELSFFPANVFDAKLENPGAQILPVGMGAIPRDLQRLDLTQVVEKGKICWCKGRPPNLPDPQSAAEMARHLIMMLTKAADGIKSH